MMDKIIPGGYYWDIKNQEFVIGKINQNLLDSNGTRCLNEIYTAHPIPLSDDIIIKVFGFNKNELGDFTRQNDTIKKVSEEIFSYNEKHLRYIDDLQDIFPDINIDESLLRSLLPQNFTRTN